MHKLWFVRRAAFFSENLTRVKNSNATRFTEFVDVGAPIFIVDIIMLYEFIDFIVSIISIP